MRHSITTERSTRTLTTRCQYCGRELPKRNFALPGHKPMMITLPCDCADAQREAERESKETDAREKAEAFADVWRRANVPEEFAHVPADKRAFDTAQTLFDGRALYFLGKNGRGKTYAACQVAKAYLIKSTYRDRGTMRCWKSCQFVTAQGVLSSLRSSWDRWDQNEEDVFQRWAGVDLLILDDLGKGVPSEWAAENMFRLVDARWSSHRPMIVTSQYDADDLADRYAKAGDETMGALMSRLDGWCVGREFGGPDRRLEK